MINEQQIKQSLESNFKKNLQMREIRKGLYQVYMPFYYSDGDMIDVFIGISEDELTVQDMGMSLMKLSYSDFNLTDKRKKIFNKVIDENSIEIENSNLFIKSNLDNLYPALMTLVQVIIQISDLNYLSRENVKNLFYEHVNEFMFERFEGIGMVKDKSPEFDTSNLYPSPYFIPAKKPISIFPVSSDAKANEVTITSYAYDKHNYETTKLVIYENMPDLSQKSTARLTEVVDKQFPYFNSNTELINNYIHKLIES